LSSPDAGPLFGRSVAVGGDDAAATHSRRLLTDLGATVTERTSAADVTIALEPAAVIEDWARSGAMALTGYPGRPPSPARPGAGTALRAALATTAALAALREGEPHTLPDVTLLGERAAINGSVRHPGCSTSGSARTVQAADGWCVISIARASDVDLVAALVQADIHDDVWSAISQWVRTQPAAAAVDRAQLLGLAAAGVASRETPDRQPIITRLGGVRTRSRRPLVIDLSALWAGPLCASLLEHTGADVVKVEDVNRPDGARRGPPDFYDLLHARHRSVALDLATSRGRRQLTDLIASADVVIESSRPRALQQLGVDAGAAVARGTIWTSITAYGRSGRWSNRVGFGDDVAAAAGLVAEFDGVPVPCGDAVADPLAGAHAAAATTAALLDDHGFLIDVSMRDVAAAAAAIAGEPCDVVGNEAGWTVEWDGGSCAVAPPTRRRVTGHGPASGADNDAVLCASAPS
jgi:crotonobetainyl-CoA:carnitine CoA-transferase CaiB-like acyl-CoA transferase